MRRICTIYAMNRTRNPDLVVVLVVVFVVLVAVVVVVAGVVVVGDGGGGGGHVRFLHPGVHRSRHIGGSMRSAC